ncbi:MAG: hypothetical protein ABWZ15_13580 [Acidimicrobiia bacterium]
MRRSVRLFAVAAALVLVLAACGGDDDDDDAASSGDQATTTTAPADEEADATTTTAPADASGGASDQAATVAYAETSLGDALVDESGLTLYVFNNDTEPNVSTCTEGCAEAWPPVIVPGDVVVGDDLDEGLFTTFDRGNGEMQLAVDGHPLYRFSGDAAAGDVNGQGVGEVWFVAAPDGSAVQAAAAEGASQGAAGY